MSLEASREYSHGDGWRASGGAHTLESTGHEPGVTRQQKFLVAKFGSGDVELRQMLPEGLDG